MILGLVGERFAGKDTIAEYLVEKYGALHIRHSHILDEILDILNIEKTRRNEIDLGMALRKPFGEEVLANALKKRVEKSENKIIVINGIRFQHELENAKQLGAKIIYVTAPEKIRYERFMHRQEKADDGTLTLEQFQAQTNEPTEITIPKLGQQADHQIENSDSLENLYSKIEELLKTLQ